MEGYKKTLVDPEDILTASSLTRYCHQTAAYFTQHPTLGEQSIKLREANELLVIREVEVRCRNCRNCRNCQCRKLRNRKGRAQIALLLKIRDTRLAGKSYRINS